MIVLSGESHLSAVRLGAIRLGEADRSDVNYWPLGKGNVVPTRFFDHDLHAKSVSTIVPTWRNRVFSKDTLTFDG